MSLDDVGKYSVTHKDITNILAGDSQSFLKRSLWEFILDLFPMSHIKEAKQAIVDFVTKTDDKVEMFNRVKSLADQDQQWRFNTTTEFTVDENKDIIVSRVFNININAQDYHNDAEKTQCVLYFLKNSAWIFISMIFILIRRLFNQGC
ncbi:TPA: hypothetical protein JTP58_003769 [Escherichia coli]|uniref:hypothetical protein n=1 Tax=Escherichia coli TaxID=562 RepID=UPI00101C619D|nr:hypothetical protein [Escherichia coli]EJI3585512.1 hypothetical protein [Escherichia coli]HBB7145766.1 hypothetical protein [Escherichia coli]